MVRWYDKWFARQLISSDKKKPDFSLEKIAPELRAVQGRILEIGPGVAATLAYIPKSVQYVALEPNESFHEEIKKSAQAHDFKNVEIVNGFMEHIPFPENSFDFVIVVRA